MTSSRPAPRADFLGTEGVIAVLQPGQWTVASCFDEAGRFGSGVRNSRFLRRSTGATSSATKTVRRFQNGKDRAHSVCGGALRSLRRGARPTLGGRRSSPSRFNLCHGRVTGKQRSNNIKQLRMCHLPDIRRSWRWRTDAARKSSGRQASPLARMSLPTSLASLINRGRGDSRHSNKPFRTA